MDSFDTKTHGGASFQTLKRARKSSDHNFQIQKSASHLPVTVIPE